MSNWIKCYDKMPDEDQWVLIPNYNKQYGFEPDVTMAQYRDCFQGGCCGVKFHCIESNDCVPYINHEEVMEWQPLPKPPNDEELTKNNDFLKERLCVDKDGNCTHFHTTLNRTECFDCGEVLK